MKRIGVISDTHIPRKAKELPDALLQGLQGVDMIIHAGDINADSVIYELEAIAPVVAVSGNTDNEQIWWQIGRKRLIEVEKVKIGIIHGDGSYGTAKDRAAGAFRLDKPQCVVFGHSHAPFNEVIDGVLYFNPGSPTDKRMQEKFSYGILEIDGDKVTGTIKYFL